MFTRPAVSCNVMENLMITGAPGVHESSNMNADEWTRKYPKERLKTQMCRKEEVSYEEIVWSFFQNVSAMSMLSNERSSALMYLNCLWDLEWCRNTIEGGQRNLTFASITSENAFVFMEWSKNSVITYLLRVGRVLYELWNEIHVNSPKNFWEHSTGVT